MSLKPAILTFFLTFTALVNAQVSFTAEASKTTLGVNEHLRVDFSMNQPGDNFDPPNFSGFTVIAGPSQSIRNMYVNGKRSFQKTYSYYLKPNQTGKFSIGPAQITIDGKSYKTEPIDILVSDAVASPDDGNDSEDIVSENIHLVAEISNTNPYLNEGITVVYKLYVSPQISVSEWRPIDNPTFADFWSQNIDIQRLHVVENATYKGEPYRYVVLRKTVLYPQTTGKSKLEPLSLSVTVDIPTDQFDIFGRRHYERVQKTLSAGNQTIEVKPLPVKNKPASFTGAVGKFDFEVSETKNSLKATESFEVQVKVTGKGNLKLFDLPKLTVPDALEKYDPEHSEDITTNLSGMIGSISDTYTIVPRTKGKYPLPPIEFSYFDPESGIYRTLTSDEIVINVESGPNIPLGDPADTTADKQAVVAQDQFRYIKLDANLGPIEKNYFWGSSFFWALCLAPLFAIPIVILFGKKRAERANDITGNRIKKADKLAKKYLSEAKKNLGKQKEFYDALERALHNYLKAKLNIQTGEMSKEHIKNLLDERGATEETNQSFTALLTNCEFARYTPTSSVAMQQDYKKAAKTISELDKQVK